jgi:transcriptional regulator with XRE-family HTH domain
MPQSDDDTFWSHVGLRYRVARLALGLTEKEAATAAGVTMKIWRKWETNGPAQAGHLGPLDFAAKFNVSIAWLFYGKGAGIGSHLAQNASGVIAILPRGMGQPMPRSVLHKKRTAVRPVHRKGIRA